MKLIFIFGLPASGKLTVANELATLTGYKVFHNHLVVDLLLSVFDFGSNPFVEIREDIWLSVFKRAAESNLPGLIFTFAPEATVRPTFVAEAIRIVEQSGGTVEFIELTYPMDELKRRISEPSRQQFGKLTSLKLFEELHSMGAFHAPQMPHPSLSIDTTRLAPPQAAEAIAITLRITKA